MEKKLSERKSMSLEEEKRVERANEIYSELCQKNGIKVSSWENFESWQSFVNGNIGEAQFTEQAKSDLQQFTSTFGKYVAIGKEEPTVAPEEVEKRERAKRANRIYKTVCNDAGVTVCFFNRFATWSDYVSGKISETEFLERAQIEMQEMVENG